MATPRTAILLANDFTQDSPPAYALQQLQAYCMSDAAPQLQAARGTCVHIMNPLQALENPYDVMEDCEESVRYMPSSLADISRNAFSSELEKSIFAILRIPSKRRSSVVLWMNSSSDVRVALQSFRR